MYLFWPLCHLLRECMWYMVHDGLLKNGIGRKVSTYNSRCNVYTRSIRVSSCTVAVGRISSIHNSSTLFWGLLSPEGTVTRSLTAYSWNQCSDWFVCSRVWTRAVVERSRLSSTILKNSNLTISTYFSSPYFWDIIWTFATQSTLIRQIRFPSNKFFV